MQEHVGPRPGRRLHELAVVGPGLLRLRRKQAPIYTWLRRELPPAEARQENRRQSNWTGARLISRMCFEGMKPDGSCQCNGRSRDRANCALEDGPAVCAGSSSAGGLPGDPLQAEVMSDGGPMRAAL
jgi:hypothetical protein